MNETFCGVQFKKMIFSALLMTFAENLSDAVNYILAAQILNDNAMAAVNLVTPLAYSVFFLSALIATGTAYLYSFEIGAFRQEKANKLVGQGAILAVTLSILLAVILFFGREIFFSLFEVTGEIETFAREYYSIFFLAIAINPIFFFMQMIVYNDGGEKNCVIGTFLTLFVNIVASIILGTKFGISGIAFGTILGELSAILVFAKWIFFDSETLKPILYISLSETVRVMKFSFVHATLYLYIGLGNMILNAFFLQTFGEQNFPVLSVVVSILQFAIFLGGVIEAAQPLVNVYLGEKNFDGVKKVMTLATKAALLSGAAIIPIFLLFGEEIAGLFNIGADNLSETVFAIRAIGFSMPFIALVYLFSTYYQICGHMKIAFALSFFKEFGFYLLMPIICGLSFGMNGFFIGMMLSSIVSCVLFTIFLLVRHRKSFPLLLPQADIVSWDAKLNLERVLELRDRAEAEFLKRGINSKLTMKISLIIEEIGMSIVDNNPNDEPLAELTLIFGEKMQIIIRDNGKRLDLTDETVNSFRSFFIYSFLEGSGTLRSYLTTQNYNRHIFTLKNSSRASV